MRPDKGKYPIPNGGRFGDPRPGRKHVGLDLATPMGVKLVASKSGKINFIGRDLSRGGRGLYFRTVNNDGTGSLQQHLEKVLKTPGQSVKQGQVVAISGRSGYKSNGQPYDPHTHVEETNKAGTPIDPEKVYEDMYKGKSAKYWYERSKHYKGRALLFKGAIARIKSFLKGVK